MDFLDEDFLDEDFLDEDFLDDINKNKKWSEDIKFYNEQLDFYEKKKVDFLNKETNKYQKRIKPEQELRKIRAYKGGFLSAMLEIGFPTLSAYHSAVDERNNDVDQPYATHLKKKEESSNFIKDQDSLWGDKNNKNQISDFLKLLKERFPEFFETDFKEKWKSLECRKDFMKEEVNSAKNIYEMHCKNIELFFSDTYLIRQDDEYEIVEHLLTIIFYYQISSGENFQDYPLILDSKLDLIAIQLITKLISVFNKSHRKGLDIDRLDSSDKGIKKGYNKRKQPVIEEFMRLKDKEALTKHRIATIIKKRIEERGQKAPTPKTIKKYLEEEGLIS